jgi:hypothetical protein
MRRIVANFVLVVLVGLGNAQESSIPEAEKEKGNRLEKKKDS